MLGIVFDGIGSYENVLLRLYLLQFSRSIIQKLLKSEN